MFNLASFLVLGAGLLGAAGVALSARASHSGGGNLAIAAQFFLLHAPALLALGYLPVNRVALYAGLIMLAAVLIFGLDLMSRHYTGARLFPFAAPMGGAGMMLAWICIAVSAFWLK